MGMSDYGSHFSVLAAVVAQTTGPVLELGVGDYSTPMLHYMCRGRLLVSADSDLEWLKRFTAYACPRRHEFQHVTDWAAWPMPESTSWAVALVDHAPGERRVEEIKRLKGRCRFIVVHDTETDYATGANYGYEPVLATFAYRSDFRRYRPYTTIVSDEAPFPIEECDRAWRPPA